jgi:hypothetical protein
MTTMKHNKNIISKLEKLRNELTLSASLLEKPGYFSEILTELLARKIIDKIPTRKGQWGYKVKKVQVLETMLKEYYNKEFSIPERIDKVEATRITGSAHDANESKFPSIPLRATMENTIIKHGSNVIDVYDICSKGVGLYLPINTELEEWELNGKICLIENQRFFWEAEKVVQADYYIYLQGNFSNNIVKWLILPNMKKTSLIYCGDYDPSGIKLYLRIKKHLPDCEYYIPNNFEELLNKYGNNKDLTKQQRDFSELLIDNDTVIQRIRKAFEKTGKTLQQEALLI